MNEQHLDNLAGEIFRTFARIEYALKAAGFHYGDGNASANWRVFAESLPDLFDYPKEEKLQQVIRYTAAHPPKKRMVVDGVLDWRDATPETDLKSDEVLTYVRRVRNNLFHGGKFNGSWFEPERSEELLRHSLTILRACLDASDDVREAYHG